MKITLIYATWPERFSGQGWHGMPALFREKFAAEQLASAGHDVEEFSLESDPSPKGAFTLAGEIGVAVRRANQAERLPLVVCGSCAVAAFGAISGLGGDAGILWMDAHPDLNTPETTRSGLLEGMALAGVFGLAWRTMAREYARLVPAEMRNAALFGVRDIEPAEAELISVSEVARVDSAEAITERLASRPAVYIHLDMDVHDALELRVNGYGVPGGPSIGTVRETMRLAGRGLPLRAVALTGLEPGLRDASRGVEAAIGHVTALAASMDERPWR